MPYLRLMSHSLANCPLPIAQMPIVSVFWAIHLADISPGGYCARLIGLLPQIIFIAASITDVISRPNELVGLALGCTSASQRLGCSLWFEP